MKKGFSKSILTTVALFIMVACLLPSFTINAKANASVASSSSFASKISALRTKFPHEKYWNHYTNSYHNNNGYASTCTDSRCNNPDGYTSTACTTHSGKVTSAGKYDCNNFDGGIQCVGFARKIFYDVWGEYATRASSITPTFENLQPGDYVSITTSSGGSHAIFVIGKSGNTITTVEGNVNGNCKIYWDNTRTKGSFTVEGIQRASSASSIGVEIVTTQTDKTNSYTSNNAILYGTVYKPSSAAVQKLGMRIAKQGSDYSTGKTYKYPPQSGDCVGATYVKIEFDIKNEVGYTLTHATTYKYQFYAQVGGQDYWSQEKTFTTTGSHSYGSWSTTTKATCTAAGEEKRTCSCGAAEKRAIAATGHSFTNYISNGNATCTANGTETAKCNRCSQTNTRTDSGSALGHSYRTAVSVNGTVYTCTRCSDSYTVPHNNGWQRIDGKWYLCRNGKALTGWQYDGGCWYYMNSSGVMQTGWIKLGNTWYYMKSSGAMATGWLKLGNTWYYMKSSGAMATGWLKLGNTWYYMQSSGAMKTGWLKLGSAWYYLNSSGAMVAGKTLTMGGVRYTFNSSGVWIR